MQQLMSPNTSPNKSGGGDLSHIVNMDYRENPPKTASMVIKTRRDIKKVFTNGFDEGDENGPAPEKRQASPPMLINSINHHA